MTGEKDKFTTIEKLWKIDDSELSTPKHDELVLHLLARENYKKVLDAILFRSLSECAENPAINVICEKPISNGNKFLIGYVDIVYEVKHPLDTYGDSKQDIYIEVKPTIRSFGETLRQINTYRHFEKNAMYVIYSPDIRFRIAFETQGVIFITPEDIGIKM